MKYKNIELELPPLGEILVALNKNGEVCIGYFYLRNEEREFCTTFRLYNVGIYVGCVVNDTTIKWARLPKFKIIKKEQPPIGIEVLFSGETERGRGYTQGVNLKGYAIETKFDGGKVDTWIEFEAFKED